MTCSTPFAPPPDLPGADQRYVRVNGFRMHVVEAGAGPPLLLLHGWPQHWWMWRDLIGPLGRTHRVICPDLRGLGWSEAPRTGYSRGELARDLLALLDALDVSAVDVVAHDWGLIPAYWLALFWSWRVRRLVALGGPHIWASHSTPVSAFLRLWHFAVLASPAGPFAVRHGLALYALQSWRHNGEFSAREMRIYLEPVRRTDAAKATGRRYRRIIGDFVFYARHATDIGLAVPTLNLVGEHDLLANASHPNRFMTSNAVDFRYELVPDAGHFLAEERPAYVAARVSEFLA